MKSAHFLLFCQVIVIKHCTGFSGRTTSSNLQMIFGASSGGGKVEIPKDSSARDRQAIAGIKAAMGSSSASSLLECEFPVLEQLNKLGDGSLRSAKEAEQANLDFVMKLIKELKPFPFLGPRVWLMTSSASSKSFDSAAAMKSKAAGAVYHSLRNGLPTDLDGGDIVLLLNPSSRGDYSAAKTVAFSEVSPSVVIINGFAKDQKSVPDSATMAYYYKPLTYNSQIAGYLIRKFPEKWTTIDAATKETVLVTSDNDILVRGTNTPDLRNSVRAIQKAFDTRAIMERKSRT
uniref:DUF1995 domain-containing protein n=1 Tax=Leptocylindrus danicus TaxID=163516 RepID=A0A7S2PB79_9STRA|mmetsp:Transcript_28347/g.41704  ORF Transcript_28347/g.41704 Transcript_28347/m.41704 type:complete len:289 (+) Transcript_28347:66-932(+)